MRFYFTLILFASLFLMLGCEKDTPQESFLRGGNCIIPTSDGNMLIAGYNVGGAGNYDGFVQKVSSAGEPLWSKYYGNGYMDSFNQVIATSDGFVFTGFYSLSDYHTNLIVLKTNSAGEQVWLTKAGTDKISQGFSICQSTDNGFVACGLIRNSTSEDRDVYLVKLNSGGEIVWEKRYGVTKTFQNLAAYDEAYSIIPDDGDGFYVAGSMDGYESCCGKAFLMHLDANGDSSWTKKFTTSSGISLARAADGGVVMSGVDVNNGQDIFLLKTDTAGTQVWAKTIGGAGFEYGSKLIATADQGFAISGIYTKSGSTNQEVALFKFDKDGATSWSKTYGGDNVEQGYGLIQNEDLGFSITGMSNTGGSYIFLNKTDAAGAETWQKLLK
ncbi:MAG: hypothetical protein IPH88_11630 [Bacteroidales bacterium]|nr:hypothetical protein [Bacteroidales bacterium]